MQKRFWKSIFVAVLCMSAIWAQPVFAKDEPAHIFARVSKERILGPLVSETHSIAFAGAPDFKLILFSRVGIGVMGHVVAGSGPVIDIYLPDKPMKFWVAPLYNTCEKKLTVMAGFYMQF